MVTNLGFIYATVRIYFNSRRECCTAAAFSRRIISMPLRLIGLALIFLLSPLYAVKPPQLTPKEARGKIEEILHSHVSHHKLSSELVTRAFENFLHELDPTKTYFLESEITKWTAPSEELLEASLRQMEKGDYTEFEEIYRCLIPAVGRRRQFEEQITTATLKKGMQPSDFKDITWSKTEEELYNRLLSIRSIQLDSAEKLDADVKEQFIRRVEKRREKREEELLPETEREKQQVTLTLVLKSVSSALDSQTAYFTPSEANQFMVQVQQRLFGIGAQLRDDLNGFSITRLLEGGPAKESEKLHVGDKIIAVNGEPVVGLDIIEAVELIRGPKGSPVDLTILRERGEGQQKTQEKLIIPIVRGEVVLKETRLDSTYEPYGDGAIGIVHLHSFYQDAQTSSTGDIRAAIEELKSAHNLKGIILDLRDNGGGLLPQAVSVTGLFIRKGIVVSIMDNTGSVQHLRNVEANLVWDGPLTVLTNRASASAAEIVAQTLQDYGRAIVIGDETTFGKGTFQTFTLESSNYGKINTKGEYKVTRGRYYTVSGKSPQLVGVKADIIVPGLYSELEIGEKYSKFPLENHAISPNFEDDLSDVPPSHRSHIARLYRFDLQPILYTYESILEPLKKNSHRRIEQNKNYQNFLKEVRKKDLFSENPENYGLCDLQLTEATNIMKDMILLLQEKEREEKKAA